MCRHPVFEEHRRYHRTLGHSSFMGLYTKFLNFEHMQYMQHAMGSTDFE